MIKTHGSEITIQVKIRPEHVSNLLELIRIPQGLRKAAVQRMQSDYTREMLLKNLNLISEYHAYEIVPSIDDFCDDCRNKDQCGETDATLFDFLNAALQKLPLEGRASYLKRALKGMKRVDPAHAHLVDSFPFTHLIGKIYSVEELERIKSHPEEALKHIA